MIDVAEKYINCWQDYSRFRMLYRILEGIGVTHDVHRQSTATDVLLERIQSFDDAAYVVVLDEVDQLEDLGVLYQLYQISNLSMILIANREEEFFFQLDERIRSRLQSGTRVQLDRYGLDELVSILADRVQWGLTEGAVRTETLERIADAAAGDARIALGVLRVAAQQADRQGMDRITPELVDASVPEAEEDIRRKSVDQLTADQRILYDIISEHGAVEPGCLYSEYRKRVDEPKTRRTMRNYLSKMQRYKLIVAEGENRGRKYRLQRERSNED